MRGFIEKIKKSEEIVIEVQGICLQVDRWYRNYPIEVVPLEFILDLWILSGYVSIFVMCNYREIYNDGDSLVIFSVTSRICHIGSNTR